MYRRFKSLSFLSSGLAAPATAGTPSRDHDFAHAVGTALEGFAAAGGTLPQAAMSLMRYSAATSLVSGQTEEDFLAAARYAYRVEREVLKAHEKGDG